MKFEATKEKYVYSVYSQHALSYAIVLKFAVKDSVHVFSGSTEVNAAAVHVTQT